MTEGATAATAPATETGYIVLGKVDGPAWGVVSTDRDAKNAATAIRNVVGRLPAAEQSGTFVAVPARSWKPVKISAKTETRLIVEDA